jgi:hypothetical protein
MDDFGEFRIKRFIPMLPRLYFNFPTPNLRMTPLKSRFSFRMNRRLLGCWWFWLVIPELTDNFASCATATRATGGLSDIHPK